MTDLPDTLERLTARLETLERRVAVLEHPSAVVSGAAVQGPNPVQAVESGAELSIAQAGIFSVLGRALLGIAGAYVLRAVAESSSLPRVAIAGIAIAYAMMWLVWAVRVPAGAWFASTIYAGTSALILAPMLWELTLNFKVLPVEATASILGGFVIAASALAWKRNVAPVFWVANLAAVGTALALSVATHDLAPFIAVLLLMAIICEYAADCHHAPHVRLLVAAAADLAIWGLVFIYSSPPSTRVDYPAIGAVELLIPGCVLFLIYGTSIGLRIAVRGEQITAFETGQALIAFLLAAAGVLYFEPGSVLALGLVCLLLSAAGYAAVLVRFHGAAEDRNYKVFAAWSAGLLLAGSALSLPPLWQAVILGLAAIAAAVLGVRVGRLTLEFYGLVFAAAAAVQSGLLRFTLDALAGSSPARLGWSVCFVSSCLILCYAVGKSGPGQNWQRQTLRLATAALAAGALAALVVEGLLWLAALGVTLDVHHIAFVRTLTTCALALALAYGGARWRRVELTRLAYATLGLVAAKLLFEDLRHGHLGYIAGSIFLFAIALIAVPRLSRAGQKAQG